MCFRGIAQTDDAKDDAPAANAAFPSLGEAAKEEDASSFPTLGAAATVKETKKEKKAKTVKLSLAEFAGGAGGGGGSSYAPPGRSGGGGGGFFGRRDEIVLPSGPSSRPDDESRDERLGGGFDRGYGGDRYGDRGDRDERRPGRYERDAGEFGDRESREEQGPSRADMSSNWGSDRRAPPADDRYGDRRGGYGERRGGFGDRHGYGDRGGYGERDGGDRYGGDRHGDREERRGFGDFAERPPREELGPSRADESESWSRDRKQLPERESRYEDRAPQVDRDWGSLRNRTAAAQPPADDRYAPQGERPKLQLKPRSESASTNASSGSSSLFGGAKPVDVKYVEDKPREAVPARSEERPTERRQYEEPKDSDGDRWGRKPSFNARKEDDLREATPEERAARPKLSLQKRSTDAPVGAAQTQSSLFGGARPREEALKEAGRDWQAEDLKRSVDAVKRKEFKEEKELKAKIQAAKDAGEDVSALELELTKLSLQLDDKIRFAKPKPHDAKDAKDAGEDAAAPAAPSARAPKTADAPAPVAAKNVFDALADELNA